MSRNIRQSSTDSVGYDLRLRRHIMCLQSRGTYAFLKHIVKIESL